jgi:hypothetical protein
MRLLPRQQHTADSLQQTAIRRPSKPARLRPLSSALHLVLALPCLLVALLGCSATRMPPGIRTPEDHPVLWGYVEDYFTGERMADVRVGPPNFGALIDRDVITDDKGMYVDSLIREPGLLSRVVHVHGWYEGRLDTVVSRQSQVLRHDFRLSRKHPPEWRENIDPEDLPAVYGYVTNYWTGQPLAGAAVFIPFTDFGAATDAMGRFTIQHIPLGLYRVECSFMGFNSVALDSVYVDSSSAVRLDFELEEESL